ncbi:MAG: acyl--CoA ligase [Rhodospirillaceae bacterium]|nr:acyl--CoA ligase [Rhodospirillaceae bacterium]
MIKAYNLGALFEPSLGGDTLALIDCRVWDAPKRYSHRQIDDLANACARGLLRRGLEPGDAVAILSSNSMEFIVTYLAVLRAGMIAVPINYKFPKDIIEFILQDAAVKHVICDDVRRQDLTTNLPITNLDATDASGFEALQEPGDFEVYRPSDTDVAMVLYTSGSTGRPKGVPLTHKGHIWALKGRMSNWPFTNHRLLVAAPLYHMNALCTFLFGLAAATSIVLLPEFDARRYLQAIDTYKCTWITSVPTMLAMVLKEEDLIETLDFSSVQIVRMGSAPVSGKLWDRVKAMFPGANVMNVYGTTEAGPIVFGPTGGKPISEHSLGRQMPEIDLKLVDAKGQEAEEGVLWQRTPANMSGYLNLPEKTAEVLTADGWYVSGDVFRRDKHDCYFFVGRSDDMFVCGGENIYPGQVEAVLVSHPEIEHSCVVPVPDDIKGEKPVAFVVRQSGSQLTEDAVKQHAIAKAPAYQHPRMVIFLDELPLAGPGKIDRNGMQTRALGLWQTQNN